MNGLYLRLQALRKERETVAVKPFKRILVANRGEIAIRIFRACHDLSMNTVAIYSKEDAYNRFRTKADESYLIGENKSPLGAYLDIDLIIDLAKRKKVDAIHPGYGFLSENADFARACEEAGITFIGPPSNVLGMMGDKLAAKEIAKKCGVPIIPGCDTPLERVEQAIEMAEDFGYPIILKAASGGGGRGMRKCENAEEVRINFELVKSEAKKAFGNDDVFIEKFLVEPKHIEVQILADHHGNVIHVGERDCSLQCRYQKVVEFTPAFTVSKEIREKLYADAIKISRHVGYVNAGTVEFLVDQNGNHYFIEMNPRIQVEHTVTEMVTGIDLVRSQILIAQGEPLSHPYIGITKQEDVPLRGYAIQCRVTTEDPSNNFAPDTGKLTSYRSGGGFGVRLDSGNVYAGAEVSPFYDSLLTKVTVYDSATFESCCKKAVRALSEMSIRGVKTNIGFITNILNHPQFIKGQCHTKFIDETPELFDMKVSQDRATKALRYIGDIIVNKKDRSTELFDPPRVPQTSGELKSTFKHVLDTQGPDAVKKMVLAEKKLLITDTTFRDAHQSLLATRVRTNDLETIAPATASILSDAFSLEMWGGATFDVAYRFLNESPWERLDILREKIPNIPFQMLFRGANAVGYTNYPDNLIRAFIKQAAKSGIDVFRVFDSLNWLPGMELALDEVLNQGKLAEATLCYTGDLCNPDKDKYNLKYYVEMAKKLEKRGAHMLCIKDMSGLLKPYAAKQLVKALKEEVGLPIHLHTHDTSGNQIATLLMAAEAGVDIVDVAISSMSSLTSQPSMNSLVAALDHQERDTGMSLRELQKLTNYWEDVRKRYSAYESDIKNPITDIYRYEIPGGQYTNLKPQVESLGLGHRFDEVKEKYLEVNNIMGDIVKVTPSSKMVGDMAIFMVQNDLTSENIVAKGETLTFPDSVVSYFKGMMGQPAWGFPEDLRKVVLKGEEPISCRPGELLPEVDFEAARKHVEQFQENPSERDIIGWCLYPKVLEDFFKHRQEYGYISKMDTRVFFDGMVEGETFAIDISEGKTLIIKYIGLGGIDEDGYRTVCFELNGMRREVAVKDKNATSVTSNVVMADPTDKSHIGASIPGMVSKINIKPGDKVVKNQVLAVIEAMKMETSVIALMDGEIENVYIKEGQSVKAGELLATIK